MEVFGKKNRLPKRKAESNKTTMEKTNRFAAKIQKINLQITLRGFHGKIDAIGDVIVVAGGEVGKFRQNEVDIVACLAELHRLYFVSVGKNARPFVSAGREADNINIAVSIVENVTAYAVALDVVGAARQHFTHPP